MTNSFKNIDLENETKTKYERLNNYLNFHRHVLIFTKAFSEILKK